MTIPKGPILVVEDMPQIRGLLEVTLRFEGYPVVSASDGLEALDIIATQHPSMIITDILMPNMDGYALVYQLRKNPETQHIPIVFLSATYVTKEDKDFALSLGAVKFLEKPVDTADFLLTIGEILAEGPDTEARILDERAFYEGYRHRLENKLRQKNQQITRTERLLTTLPEAQKAAFEKLLEDNREQREHIIKELEEVNHSLQTVLSKMKADTILSGGVEVDVDADTTPPPLPGSAELTQLSASNLPDDTEAEESEGDDDEEDSPGVAV